MLYGSCGSGLFSFWRFLLSDVDGVVSSFLINKLLGNFSNSKKVVHSVKLELVCQRERSNSTHLSRLMPFVSGIKNHTKKNIVKEKLPKIKYVP